MGTNQSLAAIKKTMGVSKIHSIFTERREFNDWASHPWKRRGWKRMWCRTFLKRCFAEKDAFCSEHQMIVLCHQVNFIQQTISSIYDPSQLRPWFLFLPGMLEICRGFAKLKGVHCPRGNGSCMMPSSRGPNSRWNSRKHKRATWLKHSSWAQLQWTLISLWCLWKCRKHILKTQEPGTRFWTLSAIWHVVGSNFYAL